MGKFLKWMAATATAGAVTFGLLGGGAMSDRFGPATALADDPGASFAADEANPQWVPGDGGVLTPATSGGYQAQASVNMTVVFFDSGPIGTSAWPAEAKVAVQRAASILASYIEGTGPISIEAYWTSNLPGNSIGRGGSSYSFNFPDAPQAGVWYPDPLRNLIEGQDYDPTTFDIKLEIKNTVSWWYGEGQAQSGTDLTSVAMHELMHGLGMVSNFNSSDGSYGAANLAFLHERFVSNASGTKLVTGMTQLERFTALGSPLYFDGPNAIAANGGTRPKLHETSPGHLDEATFLNSGFNSLMTPTLQGTETIRQPGPIALGILKDYGYTILEPAGNPGTIQFGGTAYLTPEYNTIEIPVTRTGGTYGRAEATCVRTSGSATPVTDFTIANATVAWEDGESGTRYCEVVPASDGMPEAAETIVLGLSDLSGATAGSPAAATVTIMALDVDCANGGTIEDALAALRKIAGFTTGLLPVAPCTGDVDGNGTVNLVDVLLVQRWLAEP